MLLVLGQDDLWPLINNFVWTWYFFHSSTFFLVWRWQRCTPFLPPAGQFSFFLLVKSQSPKRQWKKSFFAKTKWPKFSLWSADITSVTTAKQRKMYNNLWQNYLPHFFPSRRYTISQIISEGGECADALAASDNEGSRGENVFLSMRERTKPSQRGKLRGTWWGWGWQEETETARGQGISMLPRRGSQ